MTSINQIRIQKLLRLGALLRSCLLFADPKVAHLGIVLYSHPQYGETPTPGVLFSKLAQALAQTFFLFLLPAAHPHSKNVPIVLRIGGHRTAPLRKERNCHEDPHHCPVGTLRACRYRRSRERLRSLEKRCRRPLAAVIPARIRRYTLASGPFR